MTAFLSPYGLEIISAYNRYYKTVKCSVWQVVYWLYCEFVSQVEWGSKGTTTTVIIKACGPDDQQTQTDFWWSPHMLPWALGPGCLTTNPYTNSVENSVASCNQFFS